MFGVLWAQLRNEVKFDEYSELYSAKQMFAQLRTDFRDGVFHLLPILSTCQNPHNCPLYVMHEVKAIFVGYPWLRRIAWQLKSQRQKQEHSPCFTSAEMRNRFRRVGCEIELVCRRVDWNRVGVTAHLCFPQLTLLVHKLKTLSLCWSNSMKRFHTPEILTLAEKVWGLLSVAI